ncbi:MAG: Gfo/Idh/MocA family oxidoreductase [Acidobacteria bacterium]|nr:Gfo/Idh/MocA family oxidoreductase [Acidobacteriota bacterium]
MSDKLRAAVIGCGSFGQNHIRVIRQSATAELTATVDADPSRADFTDWRAVIGKIDAAVIATPTTTHAEIAAGLMEAGVDVLVEKPIAITVDEAEALTATAARCGRILQVGHLERFNPAVIALERILTVPLFFEIHRLSLFTPRCLDVDVVLDLMIHDVDIILAAVGKLPEEVRAAGVRILSQKVDIANVRLAFPGGCIANLTASRVSTEKVRKLRLFQPHQYISVDYTRQDGVAFTVDDSQQIGFQPLTAEKKEPLVTQWEAFEASVRTRQAPRAGGPEATRALRVCHDVLAKIAEHGAVVAQALAANSGRV